MSRSLILFDVVNAKIRAMLIPSTVLDWFVSSLLVIFATVTALHALLHKRDPRSSLLWVIVCLSLPFIGPVFYLLFGINRASSRVLKLGAVPETALSEMPVFIPDPESSHGDPLLLLGSALTGLPIVDGNQVELLENGDEAYPSMLESIKQAKEWVYLSFYIFEHQGVGQQFIDALTSAMERGVDVRVLLDGVGAWYDRGRTEKILRSRGVRVEVFLPPAKVIPRLEINLRNHRKVVLVDGKIGFTGGMNIRPEHVLRDADPKEATRDVMFRIRGPVLEQMGRVFTEDWRFACGERLPERVYENEQRGASRCRAISDGPGVHLDVLMHIIISAINSAEKTLNIITPYFLPPRELIVAIQAASLRGVDVNIILPSNNNLPYVHWAMRNSLWQYLQYGAKIYYQPPPFAHTKLLIVDSCYCQFGSANLDIRSLRLNFELNIETLDSELAESLLGKFEQIRNESTQVTLEDLATRPLYIRIWDAFWWLLTPYL